MIKPYKRHTSEMFSGIAMDRFPLFKICGKIDSRVCLLKNIHSRWYYT